MSEGPCCNSNCSSVEVVDVPGTEGAAGLNGANGTDGINAFTTLLLPLVLPVDEGFVTASVGNNQWMALNQVIVMDGAATFRVVDKVTVNNTKLQFLFYSNDLPPGTTINAGVTVSPAGRMPTQPLAVANGGTGAGDAPTALNNLGIGYTPQVAYSAGTFYSLTATNAALVFGTTSPSLTISIKGTYLLFSRVRLDYNHATFAANQLVTFYLRRTNNLPTDIANSTTQFITQVITTQYYTAMEGFLPLVVYHTPNTDDVVTIFGSVSVLPGAGTLDVVEAELLAYKIA